MSGMRIWHSFHDISHKWNNTQDAEDWRWGLAARARVLGPKVWKKNEMNITMMWFGIFKSLSFILFQLVLHIVCLVTQIRAPMVTLFTIPGHPFLLYSWSGAPFNTVSFEKVVMARASAWAYTRRKLQARLVQILLSQSLRYWKGPQTRNIVKKDLSSWFRIVCIFDVLFCGLGPRHGSKSRTFVYIPDRIIFSFLYIPGWGS